MSEQRFTVGGGNTLASARRPGGRVGTERGLDGVCDELRGLGVDGDVSAEQHAADDLPGVPVRVLECSATRWLGTSASCWVGMTGDGKGPADGAGGAWWCSGCRGGDRVVVVSRSRG